MDGFAAAIATGGVDLRLLFVQLVEELSKTTAELQQDKAANQALTQELSNAKAESAEVSSRADELSAAVEERAADCTALQEQMSELRCVLESCNAI